MLEKASRSSASGVSAILVGRRLRAVQVALKKTKAKHGVVPEMQRRRAAQGSLSGKIQAFV